MINKLTKLPALLLSIVLLLGICTACQKATSDSAAATAINNLYLDAAEKHTDILDIAAAMAQDGTIPYNLDVYEIEQGAYLNGFSTEPTGYSRGVCFCPLISTIPFVGYLFESENPEQLLSSLNESAMLDWNICTQADEIVSGIDGNRVLFVMTPSSFDN